MRAEIDFECIAEGYEPLRFGVPDDGDYYISADGQLALCSGILDQPRLIVRQKQTVKPWTFETAPTQLKVRSKKENSHRLLLLTLDSGNFCYYDAYLRDCLPFGKVLELYEQLDGSPCGEVVD